MGLFRHINKIISRSTPRSIALLYHHIGEPSADPWEMSVSPENFRSHLEVLSRDYEVLPLSCLNAGEQLVSARKPTLFITFDDGYRDNYEIAYPSLKEYGLPATFFIPTQPLNGPEIFWWETLEEIFFSNRVLPGECILELDGKEYCWEIGEPETITGKWSAWKDEALTGRQKAYLEISEILKASPQGMKEKLVCRLEKWANKTGCSNPYFAKINAAQIREVHAGGLVTIGAHSVHHPAMGTLTESVQQQEIMESRKSLESLLSDTVNAFAYPHGHYNALTKSLLQCDGFTTAFTTEENYFTARSNKLELPRIWVRNWDQEHFRMEMNKWTKGS